MKKKIAAVLSKVAPYLVSFKNLIPISLAVWCTYIIFRFLLLFRNNPYGFPFVSKPDWYIFHAICIDFIWIIKALLVFLAAGAIAKFIGNKLNIKSKVSLVKVVTVFFVIFHVVIMFLSAFDNEMQRFLGCHLSFGIANTYKDASSLIMLWDYVGNDLSIPYLQVFIALFMYPLTYVFYRLLAKKGLTGKKTLIGILVFFIASSLFINVIWTGNARMTKLRPMVTLIYNEIFENSGSGNLTQEKLPNYADSYQKLWLQIEGDSLWEFPKDQGKTPLYRVPKATLLQDEKLQERRSKKPNFLVIFLESHRGMNTGFLNLDKPSPTPYYDSIAANGRIWERMHTSGLPTTGGVLTTHTGLPHHSYKAEATELAHVNLPSYASILRDSGYVTHYFSAADPAWDNLGVWMSKWYTAQHYDRNREDDSTFFDHTTAYVIDTLAKEGKPFLVTVTTRSNHYPFNFAAGMTDEEKSRPLTERINVTMNYADRQLARFMRAVEKEEWYKNTYVIILADHAFPLGENGVSTMNGGGFSNATWIPFMVYGNGIEPGRDTIETAQIDIAPTIMELAGMAVPNMFMGHNLLRSAKATADDSAIAKDPAETASNDSAETSAAVVDKREGLSLGAYSGYAAIGMNGKRLISKYPVDESTAWLFNDSDTHQKNNLAESEKENVKFLKEKLDTLIKISDYALEIGF